MAFIGVGLVSVCIANGFPFLMGLKSDAWSTITRKRRLW